MKPEHLAWRFARTGFAFAAFAGVLLGAQQFLVKFLHDQAAHTRTVWGLLFMLLAVAGPVLPLWLLRKREAFAQLPKAKQWTTALTIPAFYLCALGLCMVASTYTKRLLIGRHGLSVLVRVNPDRPDRFTTLEMHGLGRELPSAQTRREDGPEHRFEFVGYQSYLRYPRDITMSAKGAARTHADGNVEISLNVDATESFRLQLAGLAAAEVVTQGGNVVADPFQFRPGKHELIVKGRPQ